MLPQLHKKNANDWTWVRATELLDIYTDISEEVDAKMCKSFILSLPLTKDTTMDPCISAIGKEK